MRRFWNAIYIFFVPCKENSFRPQFFESGVPIILVAALFLFKVFHFSLILSLPATSFFPQLTGLELLELTNRARSAAGLPPLHRNALLEAAAVLKGRDMIARGYFAHNDPNGNPPWIWIQKTGYRYATAGENLATGFLDAREVMDAWLSSPSHRANILNPAYREIGIAVFRNNFQGTETTIVVEFFGSPVFTEQIAHQKPKRAPITQKEPLTNPASPVFPPSEEMTKKFSLPATSSSEEMQKPQASIAAEEIKPASPSQHILSETHLPIAMSLIKLFKENGISLIEKGNLYLIILTALALVLLVLIRFEIQHPDLILRALFLITILLASFLIDTKSLLNIIPHHLII